MNKQGTEQKRKFLPVIIVGIILAVLCGISLYIRIALPYDRIFVQDWVWLRESDAYWHMRNIETLVYNFPHFNSFDPYTLYPPGVGGGVVRPFFDWLVAAIILLVSRGAPTQHLIEVVSAYMPAILGTLTLIPVYFIGKELFNRWVGVISAALVVILPTEFLHRSLLGFTDHHIAETLFSTVCILFLIMAIKRAREREISFKHILSKDWPTITKPLVYTLLAGIFLGIYLLTWQGGLLFIFIIFAYLVIQFIVDHLRHKSSDYLCIVGIPLFLIAFLMLLPILGGSDLDTISRVSLPIAIVATIVLSIISRLMAGRTLKPVYYPLTLLGLAGIGLAALHAINPSLLQSMLDKFSIFTPAGAMLTVMEVHPLTLEISWANFNTSFFISFISFAMLIYVAIKEKSADKNLFLVWSIIMLAAVFGQRRFGYYYVVNAALLTGYFSWRMLDIAGLRRLLAKPKEVVGVVKQFKKKGKKAKGKAKPKTFMQPRGAWVNVIIVGIVIFFLVFFPSIGLWREEPTKITAAGSDWFRIGYTRAVAEMPLVSMDEGWYTSLLWLKDINHSPEPFGDPNFYYEIYLPRDKFQYPETAYGVMSWWDYGYFIMQIAHRLPNANPGQANADKAGQFLTAQNESSADKVADELGTKYVMIDSAMPTTKFYAMVEWAGGSLDKFFEYYWYYRTQTGSPMPVLLAYPAHYNSTVVRLYYFDGREQLGNDTLVVSYQENVDSEGVHYKLISSAKLFSSYTDAKTYISSHGLTGYTIMGASPFGNTVIRYEEKVSEEGIHYEEITDLVFLPEPYYNYDSARAFIASQPIGNYKVLDPFISPVPLEGLEHYELRYSSDSLNTFTALGKQLPSVKIFEYLGSGQS